MDSFQFRWYGVQCTLYSVQLQNAVKSVHVNSLMCTLFNLNLCFAYSTVFVHNCTGIVTNVLQCIHVQFKVCIIKKYSLIMSELYLHTS